MRSLNRAVDHDPVPEDLSSARSRRSRRVPSPGRTARASPRGDADSSRPGVESLQMVLLQQEESLALAARRGAEQDDVVDGLAEQIVALNHQSSELQLRNDHLLEHQSALEDEVVHLHSALTATTDEKDRLTVQVADLDTKLQRSRSRTEELTGILEKLLGPTDSELDSAAAKIQARYRGAKTRRDMPRLPARDRRPGASVGPPSVSGAVSWSTAEVLVWLEKQRMGKYAHLFEEHQIDGATLLHLGRDELADLGVNNGLDRAKIAGAVRKLA